MKKNRIIKALAGLLVVLLVMVVVAIVWIDRLARIGIEKGSTYALGTDTTVKGVDIGILTGHSELSGLRIANPPGFEGEHFLQLDEGVLDLTLGSLTGDTVEMRLLSLSGIDMRLEKKEGKSNYQQIMDNLSRFESEKTPPPEKKEGKKFVIREVIIKDVKCRVHLIPLGGQLTEVTVPIDEVRLQNVGSDSDHGLLLSQLVNTLLKAIFMATVQKGGDLIPQDVLGELNAGLAKLESLKEIGATLAVGAGQAVSDVAGQVTQEAGKAAQDLGDKAKQAAEDVTTGLGGLLPKTAEEK
ncbi:MAG: hypothetical protein GXY44_02300 [Phycisphaerales bacterium]|nr:hypothetical protein [Phycisphaerales bacterium]